MKLSSSCIMWLLLLCAVAGAQESERPDHARRARPSLDREFEHELEREGKQKRSWDIRALQQGPISTENFYFLNRNMIVESGTQQLPQNESSIAINPVAPNVLISSAVDARDAAFVYLSTDGGNSWVNKNLGPVHTGWVTGNDPSVAFDYEGNAYLMYGGFPASSGAKGECGVYIARSTDNGATWQAHIPVIEHRGGTMTPDSAFEDKYYIEIDNSATSPFRGYLYTPWKRVIDRDSSTQIVLARSTDRGLTWSVPVPISPRKSGTSTDTTFGQSFPISTTGPDGTLYVLWNDGPIRSIGFSKSTDGGRTFTAPTYPVQGYPTLGTARRSGSNVYHVLKGTFRAETYPTIMADVSGSSRRGWLYMAWAAGREPDIYFSRSSDGGTTWSQPKIIHSTTTNDQWWPWLSVDETNGDIAVMYSDSRNDPENILIDTYVSYSSDGGDTWIDRKATDAMSDFRKNPYADNIFAGDYSGNAFHDGRVYPSYLDTREDNDVYTSMVNIRQPYPVEHLVVRGRYENLQEATLSWENPAMESIFGKPITDYTLVISRDGAIVATRPAGTTTFTEGGLNIGTGYLYTVRVAAGPDTSVIRSVTFRAGEARLPGRVTIVGSRGFGSGLAIDARLPNLRADSATPLGDLGGYRIYRDGELLREVSAAPADSGTVVTIDDAPSERGYYRYTVTAIDRNTPPNESLLSDTAILYAGDFSAYQEKFDGVRARFLYTGDWGLTNRLALSAPNSLTDSPEGDYAIRRNDYVQLFPVTMASPVDLRFAHIAVIESGDSGIVDVSYDNGATWNKVKGYNLRYDASWSDRTADPGDWRQEVITLQHPNPGPDATGIVRFRLKSSPAANLDGWYIDDISFGGPSGVRSGDGVESGLSIASYPNPTRSVAFIEYTLRHSSTVHLSVVDALGNTVRRLVNGVQEGGRHVATFDGTGLADGVYFYDMVADGVPHRGRIIIAR